MERNLNEEKEMNTGTVYFIDGIYGHIEFPTFSIVENQEDVKATWSKYEDRNSETGEDIEGTRVDFEDGLPLNIDKDDYFRMALLEVLRSIDKKLGNDNYVKVKEPINVTINNTKDFMA